MNRSRLEEALALALDESGEPYRLATAKVHGLPAEYADSFLDHQLSQTLVPLLSEEPEFRQGYAVHRENGWSGFGANRAAFALVGKARRTRSPAAAVDWLEKILSTKIAPGFCVMALWGVRSPTVVHLGHGVDLIPVSSIPDSKQKAWLLRTRDPSIVFENLFPPSLLGLPEVALICKTIVDPFISDLRDGAPPPDTKPLVGEG